MFGSAALGVFTGMPANPEGLTMRQRPSLPLLILFACAISGCTTTYYRVHPGSASPATTTIAPDRRIALWEHAVGAILDQGYVPQVLNKDACYISARRREDISDDAFAGTIVIFSVSPEGKVRLELSGGGLFDSEEKFFSEIARRQTQILKAIMDGA
jgi:hypothetical protein